MKLNYVDMQLNYVDMQLNCVDNKVISVDIRSSLSCRFRRLENHGTCCKLLTIISICHHKQFACGHYLVSSRSISIIKFVFLHL